MPSNIAVSIYIARGDDTLGPYRPDEAAELIKSGNLLPNDLAARDGDAAWVPLSSFLPGEVTPGTPDTRIVNPANRSRWRGWLFAVVLAGVVVAFLANGLPHVVRWREQVPPAPPSPQRSVAPVRLPPATQNQEQTQPPSPQRSVAPVRPRPAAADVKPTVETPTPPPMSKKGVQLNGVIRLISPDGIPTPLGVVLVRAYSLPELAPFLEKTKAAVQAELDRLTPLIAAAESEKNACLIAERNARQAVLDAAPRQRSGAIPAICLRPIPGSDEGGGERLPLPCSTSVRTPCGAKDISRDCPMRFPRQAQMRKVNSSSTCRRERRSRWRRRCHRGSARGTGW